MGLSSALIFQKWGNCESCVKTRTCRGTKKGGKGTQRLPQCQARPRFLPSERSLARAVDNPRCNGIDSRSFVSWACLPLGRSNPRNVSDKNPNSIACIVMHAARPTLCSRYLRVTPARRCPALDWRSPPASSGMQSAAIASSGSSGNRFASISMSCPQWIWSSMRAPARAAPTTQRSRAASSGTGER